MKDKIEHEYWFSNRQVVGIIAGVAMAAYYVTTVYNSFSRLQYDHEADIKVVKAEYKALIDNLRQDMVKEVEVIQAQEAKDEIIEDQRFNVIENRLAKKIEKQNTLEAEINKLKQKGSDKE